MKMTLIFTLTILQLGLFILFFKLKLRAKSYLTWGVLVFIVFHLLPLFIFNDAELDILRLKEVSRIFLSGKDIYLPSSFPDDFFSYPRFTPYFPFWIYFIGLADFLANRLPLNYSMIVKIPAVSANLGIAFLLLKQTQKKRLFVLYLLNPVPALISSYQGHWDTVVLFFLILGLLVFLKKRKKVISALIFSLAVLIKPWPIIFIPLLLLRIKGNVKRFLFISLFLLPLLLSISIYSLFINTSFIRIIKSIFFYQSMTGWWGVSLLIFIVGKRLFPFWNPQIFLNISKWLLGSIVLFVSCFRKIKLMTLTLLITLVVYVLTPGFSIHYLVWIIPLSLLNNDVKHYFFYSVLASIFLLFTFVYIVFPESAPLALNEYPKGLIVNLLSLTVWGYCFYWLFRKIRPLVFN